MAEIEAAHSSLMMMQLSARMQVCFHPFQSSSALSDVCCPFLIQSSLAPAPRPYRAE